MAQDQDTKVKFHYLKSNFFRVIHADGAVGGVTPSGHIFFSLYNQQPPIPELTVQEFAETGELGPEIIAERRIRDGIVREIETGVIMPVEVAAQLRDWLDERIKIIQQVQQQTHEQEKQTETSIRSGKAK